MEKLIDAFSNTEIRVVIISAIGIGLLLLILHIINWKKGKHSKFLWFEANGNNSEQEEIVEQNSFNNCKNINMGVNHGQIGDTYNGIKQREFTASDKALILQDISNFKNKYKDKINSDHITIGYPGCKETSFLADQIQLFLIQNGFKKIEKMCLMTHGVIGKKFGISNAPDNSILIEIYSPDNVA